MQTMEMERESSGIDEIEFCKCPKCGAAVLEGAKSYYCTNGECGLTMWKKSE